MSSKQRKLVLFSDYITDDQMAQSMENLSRWFPDYEWFGMNRVERIYGMPPEAPEGPIPDIESEYVRASFG